MSNPRNQGNERTDNNVNTGRETGPNEIPQILTSRGSGEIGPQMAIHPGMHMHPGMPTHQGMPMHPDFHMHQGMHMHPRMHIHQGMHMHPRMHIHQGIPMHTDMPMPIHRAMRAPAPVPATSTRPASPQPSTSRGPEAPRIPGPTVPVPVRSTSYSDSDDGNESFECSICLEHLMTAAPLHELPADNVADGSADAEEPMEVVAAGRRDGRGRGRRGRGRGRPVSLANLDANEIVATNCGHIFHRFCIERWFRNQGNRDCPSCRKKVNLKFIKLFPTVKPNNARVTPPNNLVSSVGPTDVSSMPQPSLQIPATATRATENPNPPPQILTPQVQSILNTLPFGPTFPQNQPISVDMIPLALQPPATHTVNQCAMLQAAHQRLIESFAQLQTMHLRATEEWQLQEAQRLSLDDQHQTLLQNIQILRDAAEAGPSNRRDPHGPPPGPSYKRDPPGPPGPGPPGPGPGSSMTH